MKRDSEFAGSDSVLNLFGAISGRNIIESDRAMICETALGEGPCEMVRKRGAYISSLTNFKRRKCNHSSTSSVLWASLSSGLCVAFIVSNLICGISGAQVDVNKSGRSAVGGVVIADGQPPELKSIEHNIEEQCFQNCAKQVEYLIEGCVAC